MRAVLFLLRTWSPRRRVALAGVTVLSAVTLGFVLLAGLGAYRSARVWESLRERTLDSDAALDVTSMEGAQRAAVAARHVPGVAEAVPMALGFMGPDGRQEDFLGAVILSLDEGGFETMWRPVITTGRAADQGRIHEVVVNELFVRVAGIGVGDRFRLVDPSGLISQPVVVVGVGVLPNDFALGSGFPVAYPTTAFSRAWDAQLRELSAGSAVVRPGVFLRLAEEADAGDVRARLIEAVDPSDLTEVSEASLGAAQVVDTLALQRNAYLALAIVGGLATLAIVGLVASRVLRMAPAEAGALSALGFTGRELRLAMLVPGAVAGAVAVVGAAAVVAAGQVLVPTGLARRVGVGRQLAHDATFLGLSVMVTAAALTTLLLLVASRATRDGPDRRQPVRAQSGLMGRPAVAAGLRAATGGLASAGRRQAWAAATAVAVASGGIAAVDVVLQSREGLRADLSRAGKFYDASLSVYTDPSTVATDRDALLASPSVTGLATIESFRVRVEGLGVGGISVTAQRGGLTTTIVDGRGPAGEDELVASIPFLRRLGHRVGDTVNLAGPAGTRRFRIVGAAALPYVSSTTILGEQIAITSAAREALGLRAEDYTLAADVAEPGALRRVRAGYDRLEACDASAILPALGVDRLEGLGSAGVSLCVPRTDQRVSNFDELGGLPGGAAGLFAALGLAGMAYLLSASFRRARRDLAVLRVIGFTRRQAMTTAVIQAGAIGIAGALLGLPFGVTLGRAAWRGLAEGIGVAVVPEMSVRGTLGVVAGAVVVAALIAIPFAARSVQQPPAQLLRAE